MRDSGTDQEMAFAHLVLSGTMNDRRAAEAVGLNPETAAYTKSKPRVRAYMIEPRAAVRDRLVDQETDLSRRAVEGLRKLNLGRDQILARLWELANLSHEVTRGIIACQIKALSMIAAIEGLIPDRRLSPPGTQPAATPAAGAPPTPLHRNDDRNFDHDQPSLADPLIPQRLNRVPLAEDSGFNALLETTSSPRHPFSIKKGSFTRRR
jgi:hypothetical protein